MAGYNYINSTGVIIPDTNDLQKIVQEEFQAAFGQDLVLTANTPQGILITAEVLARANFLANNAQIANQINPNIAGGVYLDAICQLTGLQRSSQTYSSVRVNLSGVAGTIVPAGTTIRASGSQNIFSSTSTVTLSVGGTASVLFQCLIAGPIAAPANTLTQIVNGVLGLETVNNPADAILGSFTQADEPLRAIRKNSLALQGRSLPEAIISNLLLTPGVLSKPGFLENISSSVQVISGVTMNPHSMYACVSGGTDLDVATTLNRTKDGGCDYTNGASSFPVSVTVIDPYSFQSAVVSFDRPDIINILVRVTASASGAVSDPAAAIKQAVLDYAAGLVNAEAGFFIGNPVSCFEIAGAINSEVPAIYVHNVETSLASSVSYSNAEIPIAIFQQAATASSSITVVLV